MKTLGWMRQTRYPRHAREQMHACKVLGISRQAHVST